jgi:hypothetical protein
MAVNRENALPQDEVPDAFQTAYVQMLPSARNPNREVKV